MHSTRSYVSSASVSMARPNFLIIGAAKSGTTSLWHYLGQHPRIYMSPRKHTRFFAFEDEDPKFAGPGPRNPSRPYAIADIDEYHALFEKATGETAIGEASHSYLYRPEAPARILRYEPGMKMIAVLRDPAERAYSHYRQMIRDGREPLRDFVCALEAEKERVAGGWWPDFHYVRMGLYGAQLRRYFELFERDQIRVYLYDDLVADPVGMLRDVFTFLNVDNALLPEVILKYNASGVPRNGAVHTYLQGLRLAKPVARRYLPGGWYRHLLHAGSYLHNKNLMKPQLAPGTRRMVIDEYFLEDMLGLQDLIRRDLTGWLG